MNRKQLTILVICGLVVGGLGWLAYQKKRSPYQESTRRMGEKLLPDFPLNDVAQVAIREGTNSLTLIKTNEFWSVQERAGYPANFSTVSEFLRKFWDLQVANPLRVPPSRLVLLKRAPDKGEGTLVEFKDASGKTIRSVLLGAEHMKEAGESAQFGGGSFPDGRYVMVGNDAQSVALVSEAFQNAEPKAETWLSKDFFKVEKLKSISVVTTNETNNWTLTRESESGEWKLAEPKPDEKLDTSKSSSVTSALSYPSFNDVVPQAEVTGLDQPAVVATLQTFDGLTYTARVGAQGTNENYYFQIAVAGELPKERIPGADEKPEDKERLDKEFAEKTGKLEEKLKSEKRLEKWTYTVSKWTIDPLLKVRKDLLADKTEGSTPGEEGVKAVTPGVPPLPGTSTFSPVVPPVPFAPTVDDPKKEKPESD